jgi:hypothetical protein
VVAAATEHQGSSGSARRCAIVGALALSCASGCSLDWSYPEGTGGAGGTNVGGGGGATDCNATRISIVSPADGSTVNHGPVDFAANVQCGEPPPDAIVWEISGSDGVLAIGYSHVTPVSMVGTFDLWVGVSDGGDVVASDMITFSTQ